MCSSLCARAVEATNDEDARVLVRGIETLARLLPDVVLCDIGLPDGDGYILAHALRENPKTAGARLIAVTVRNREEDKQRSRDAGFQLHLVKPVGPESLLRELGKPARKAQFNGR